VVRLVFSGSALISRPGFGDEPKHRWPVACHARFSFLILFWALNSGFLRVARDPTGAGFFNFQVRLSGQRQLTQHKGRRRDRCAVSEGMHVRSSAIPECARARNGGPGQREDQTRSEHVTSRWRPRRRLRAQLIPLFVRDDQHRLIPSHNYQTDQSQ
jgi:hypothetical protein